MPSTHPIRQKLIAALQNSLPGTKAHELMTVPGRGTFSTIPETAKKAAVLLLMYHRVDRIFISLIKRKQHDTDLHSGQISFPGGKMELMEDYPIETARREAKEEIGMKGSIDVLGQLTPLYIPVSDFYVIPVLAWHNELNPEFLIQQEEVDELIELDLGLLLHPQSKTLKNIKIMSAYTLKDVPAYEVHGQVIWGATAMILSELEYLLSA